MTYGEKLYYAKRYYPFSNWGNSFEHELAQYTKENCDKAKNIFDKLIDELISIGEDAGEETKLTLFHKAVEATNKLNEECDDALIETAEREQLCELFNQITLAAGLNPDNYGDGEGIASEWREW